MKHQSMIAALTEASADAGLELSNEQLARLDSHWELVGQWGARINLTAIESDQDAAWLHYRDSLEGVRHLSSGPIADMGSGAGFPGVPLAVALPHLEFTLIEPRRKRASFLRTVIARLDLPNARVLMQRSDGPPPRKFAAIVTRATFSQPQQLAACSAWLNPGGKILAFRSAGPSILPGATHGYTVLGDPRVIEVWYP